MVTPIPGKTPLGAAHMELSTQALSSVALMLLARRNLFGVGSQGQLKYGKKKGRKLITRSKNLQELLGLCGVYPSLMGSINQLTTRDYNVRILQLNGFTQQGRRRRNVLQRTVD